MAGIPGFGDFEVRGLPVFTHLQGPSDRDLKRLGFLNSEDFELWGNSRHPSSVTIQTPSA